MSYKQSHNSILQHPPQDRVWWFGSSSPEERESERGEGCLEMSLSGNVWSSDYRPTRPSNVSV